MLTPPHKDTSDADRFWSLANYWTCFLQEMKNTERLAGDPDVLTLMYFAYYAGAAFVVTALVTREEHEPGTFELGKVLESFAREHLAVMEQLAPTHEEAKLRLQSSYALIRDILDHYYSDLS